MDCVILYYIILYCIVLYYIALYCIVLDCVISYYIVLYCIVLYCIVLYCIVLYCIAVLSIMKSHHIITIVIITLDLQLFQIIFTIILNTVCYMFLLLFFSFFFISSQRGFTAFLLAVRGNFREIITLLQVHECKEGNH